MDHQKLLSHDSSSIPLIARLDHLEFIMKYLERKQRCGNNVVNGGADNNNNKQQSSESSIKEDYFKGTLMDRVASLENRLFQLCVEMDSSGSSNPLSVASTQASGESSSSQGSKGEISYSFPTFNNVPNHNGDKQIMPHNHNNTTQFKEKPEIVEEPQTKSTCSSNKQQVVVAKNNKGKKSEKKSKSEKKIVPSISWPHLKLLGC
ncbi:unnamed protein product [Lathyrus oleraceus]|uniref:Uncharacterized protein n=1 Tax=Pisum sativum TaxID=3888 RepID=A0A9D5B8Q7_PEA|nr:uncharacterized protein LOC127123436 [Pisum sativum]KAI5438023.1 hypothetical protein KIW84_023947 [Pisum sativum]